MQDYISKNKPEWAELDHLVDRAQRHSRRLSPQELDRMDVLYRKTTIQLAQVASRTRDRSLIAYLNNLTARAHSVIYLPPRRFPLKGAWRFLYDGFAQAVARTWRFHAASVLLMVLGGALAYVAAMRDPLAAYAILPASEIRQPGTPPDQLLRFLREGREMAGGFKFLFASVLFTNNLRVGLLALTTGVLAGLPAVLLMIYNGMILGALTAVYHGAGIQGEYWAWILPHGVTELSAVALCGGIGLMLGDAVVSPGLATRGESLKRAGSEAVRILLGVALMLVFAAIIESYLRQSNLSLPARYLFAGGTALFWVAYFGRIPLR